MLICPKKYLTQSDSGGDLLRIHCQEPWFSKIRAGIKTIEGRNYSDKYAQLQPGDLLEFYFNDQSFMTEVIKVKSYPTLEEYLEIEGYEKVLPAVTSFQEAMDIYLQYNSRAELEQAGRFLAIHVKVRR
ncbi:MAG TPA: hypothetical protein DEZ09_01220 [Holosporales bacterium]|nr:hypothetical protein [Holosporales bacterium]